MTERWKRLENDAAKALGGERVYVPWDLFLRHPDAVIPLPGGGRLIADCKAYKRFSHHRLIENIEAKYCDGAGDVAGLVTREPGRSPAYITLPLEFVARMLRQVAASDNVESVHIPEGNANACECSGSDKREAV